MRLLKLSFSKSEAEKKGLKPINLTEKNFGSVVALIGKNGAGKSRILEVVENSLRQVNYEHFLSDHLGFLPEKLTLNSNIEQAKVFFKKSQNSPNNQQLIANYRTLTTPFLKLLRSEIKNYIKVIDVDDLKIIKDQLTNNLTFEQILNNDPKTLGLNEFSFFNSQQTVNYINTLSNNIISEEFNLYLEHKNDKNPEIIQQKLSEKEPHKLFLIFQSYIKKFLGKEFSYRSKSGGNIIASSLYFNNQPFDIKLLSPGQKTLFAYAILLFFLEANSSTTLKESIIIIDEPEKHLHPEAQIKLITSLREIISEKGQLWIATHSINILCHLQYDEILMVKDDEIILPSRTTPGNSFIELMGLENHIEEMRSFINSVSDWAYANFMTQCFKEPDVIFAKNSKDPQFQLFKKFISDKENITLLDFGAGKGRIGYMLNEDLHTTSKISYTAYEPNEENIPFLKDIPNITFYTSNDSELKENSFDCVLLCNVLHEISPKNWLIVFEKIKKLLKPDGILMIVEDKFLPKGEKAHESGYLILTTEQLKILFQTENVLDLKVDDFRYQDRIVFNVFSRDNINVDKDSIKKSIKSLSVETFKNLKQLRKENDINQGRQYANQTQLYINSLLALESI